MYCSVDSLSVVDMEQENVNAKIVSLAEQTSKVSTINLTINLNHDETSKTPVGKVQANIAQIRLLIPVPFVLRSLVSRDYAIFNSNRCMLASPACCVCRLFIP